MNRVLVASLSLLTFSLFSLLSGSVLAADMPAAPSTYKAPPPAPVYSWTGFYVNAGGGYGMWAADTTTVIPAGFAGAGTCILCVPQTQGGQGYFGRVGLGYDYQFSVPIGHWAPQFVAGPFADTDFSSLKGTIQDQNPFFAGTTTENWSWAAGARMGVLVTPQILSYVNGGYAQTHFTSATMVTTYPGPATGFSTPAFSAGGWFLGGGVETTLAPILPAGWFLRSEYRYTSYGTQNLSDTCTTPALCGAGVAAAITFHPAVQTISTELIYKFNSPVAGATADLPPMAYKARPLPASAPSWTGIYLDAGGGYGIWAADTTTVIPAGFAGAGTCILCATQTQGGQGYFGRVGVGYDYQFSIPIGHWAPQFVAGPFADTDFSSLKGTIQDQTPFFAGTTTEDWSWAVGARAGWLATPQILSYVNGGYTQTHFTSAGMVYTGTPSGLPAGTVSGASTPAFSAGGWFLGGGVETTLAPLLPAGWFLRSEYRYAYYGSQNLPDTCTTPALCGTAVADTITFHPTVQTISAALVYKFNWFGAVNG